MLSTGAFNALLKTLEEPTENVVFILATTELHKIPATILSRVQRFEFKSIKLPDIVHHLESILATEGIAYEADAVQIIARRAEGGMRDALSILDQALSLTAGSELTTAIAEEDYGLHQSSCARSRMWLPSWIMMQQQHWISWRLSLIMGRIWLVSLRTYFNI